MGNRIGMFEHPDATSARSIIEIGDTVERVLVVETKLSLWPMSEDYNEDRVSSLEQAAKKFKVENGFDKIRLVSIREE
jgi:hypothetical protein